ncbi:MAG: diguanylate cyclase (GGDEF)-like protein [Oceanicoccus sp.]|jgi:diguanylate cyclase (GGDEF)-like protein
MEKGRRFIVIRALQGFALSAGSPIGWAVIQYLNGVDLVQDVKDYYGFYVYLAVGTSIVMAGFGAYIGRQEQLLTSMSLVDELTKLYNARYFHERLLEAYAKSIRSESSLSLIMLDIDHFKDINDRYGHLVGDKVLSSVGDALRLTCRTGEVASRVGGEEICVILENCALDKAVKASERFRVAVNEVEVFLDDGKAISVTVSGGVASSETITTGAWDVYKAADEAMYRAKKTGRNRSCI